MRPTDALWQISWPPNAAFFKLNVADYAAWKECIAFTKATFGKLNVLINNAGISYRKDVAGTTLEEWDRTIAVNQTGVFYGIQTAIEEMRTNGEKCSIANASSSEGLVAESAFFAYCAAKGAVTLMTKAAALYCGENHLNIRVNSVHPGYILTPMAYDDARQNGQTIEEYSAEFIQKASHRLSGQAGGYCLRLCVPLFRRGQILYPAHSLQ